MIAALALLISACGDSGRQNHVSSGSDFVITEPQFSDVDHSVTSALQEVYSNYIGIKNALVASDPALTQTTAQTLADKTAELHPAALSTTQQEVFERHASQVRQSSARIASVSGLESQREYFNDLTEAVYGMARAFGTGNGLYYAYCPMANDDNGGYWLSETEEIKNPYFGDEMLACGENKEQVK
jgi:hypothetical protein